MTNPQKRSFTIRGHRTSVSLERPFWDALREAAEEERTALARLVAAIDDLRGEANLSSAIRVWLLERLRSRLRARASEEPTQAAMHGELPDEAAQPSVAVPGTTVRGGGEQDAPALEATLGVTTAVPVRRPLTP